MSPAKKVSVDYKLISTAAMSDEMEEYEDAFCFDDQTVKWTQTSNENVHILYRGINLIKIILPIVFLIAIVIGIVFVIRRSKKKKQTS